MTTCKFPDCTNEVAAEGLSRCPAHLMRWTPTKPVERPVGGPVVRIPEWRRRSLAKDMTEGLA